MTARTEKWFGHAWHFICSRDCRFHLATQVGGYLISTVGELWPSRVVREIHADMHDSGWLEENRHLKGDTFDAAYMKRFGFDDIGYNRKYETMVFAAGAPCKAEGCGCGLPSIDGRALDTSGYNDAGSATAGHMKLVAKYRRRKASK